MTMGSGFPIRTVAHPSTEPAGQPSPPRVIFIGDAGVGGVRVTHPQDDTWIAPASGWYDIGQWPPRRLKEYPVTDPVETAEHFSQEAVERAVRIATEAKRQAHAEKVEQIRNRFRYHPPTHPDVIKAHEQARTLGEMFSMFLLGLPPCDERDRALDAVYLATMHANAAIARTQLGITPEVDTPEK